MGVRLQVSLVVMAVDDFTGKPIEQNRVRAWIEGERPCLVKEGGYRVFTGLTGDCLLKLEGGQYLYQEIPFSKEKMEQYSGRVFKVRMLPNRCYPIPSDTTIAEGTGKPETAYIAYCREAFSPYKLLYAYAQGAGEISIFHPEDVDIEGKSLYICTKDSDALEFFTVEGRSGEGQQAYLLGQPLKKGYKKIGTAIYPSYKFITDGKGRFYLPMIGMQKQEYVFSFYDPAEQRTQEETLRMGRINHIVLGTVNK